MKKPVKRILAVMLALMLTLGAGVGMLSASAAGTNIPTVYVLGYGVGVYNAAGEQVMPVQTPDGYISEALDACLPLFIKALVSGDEADIQAYQDLLVEWIAPIYEQARMDNNGDPNPTDWVDFSVEIWGRENKLWNGVYGIRAYEFSYDSRLDPIYNASLLNRYIELIKETTGKSKVNLVGRCEGASVVMAYLAEYGHGSVNSLFFLSPANEGVQLSSKAFSGKFRVDAYAASLWLKSPEGSDWVLPEGELIDFLGELMDLAAATQYITLTEDVVNRMYERILAEVLPDILRVSYGTMPGMWSMVANRDYDDAIKFVFEGHEAEYAGLIAKLNYYHENVALKSHEILQACKADGIDVGVITKYGYPSIPLFEESDLLSDGFTTVTDGSFGATTGNVNTTLSDSYISERESQGKGKYISPDRRIDASTCLFPDSTWFIGGIEHPNFPDWIDNFAVFFFNTPGMTIDTDPAYPQFMMYDKENDTVVPMNAENKDDSVAVDTDTHLVSSFEAFMNRLASFFSKIGVWLAGFIQGLINHARGLI